MSIYIFGDSIARGVVYNEARARYTFLKDSFSNILSRAFPSENFHNYAKFGSTVEKGLETYIKNKDSLEKGSLCLLEFGGNDCDLNWTKISENPMEEALPNVTLDRFKEVYSELINRVKSKGLHPILLTLPPLSSKRFFNWVSKELNRDNILEYLNGDYEEIFRWHKGYNDAAVELAQALNVDIIDIRHCLMESSLDEITCIDGMHPNEKGHAIIEGQLEKGLLSFI